MNPAGHVLPGHVGARTGSEEKMFVPEVVINEQWLEADSPRTAELQAASSTTVVACMVVGVGATWRGYSSRGYYLYSICK